MTFLRAVHTGVRRSVTFSGRAGRPEFWWLVLASLLLIAIPVAIDTVIFGPAMETQVRVRFEPGRGFVEEPYTLVRYGSGPLASIVGLVWWMVLLPLTSAAWRRMHDSGRPGWWLLLPSAVTVSVIAVMLLVSGLGVILAMTVIIGLVVLLAWLTHPSEPGPNRWGPDPRSEPR